WPPVPYQTIFRVISEIAVAISTRSVPVNPTCFASWRLFSRAATISASPSIGMVIASSVTLAALSNIASHELDTVLQIMRGRDSVQYQAEFDHRDRHRGLDPHYHHFRAAQPGVLGDVEQRAGGERVQHVHGLDVDHH